MVSTQEGTGPVVAQAPLVWRSTLRGVLVLDDEARLLQGLGAAVWIALADGPLAPDDVHRDLQSWGMDADRDQLESAIAALVDAGLLVS
ncbi:hypothetical protein NHL50_09545 [Acidimicrobiia bacterium EGI L10123]|uniref:hypothetical protein n=1 Tax=Salinilacustrithrix flava TaxID=2957203 RepID=UPI003D7C32B9|nr:hypothetical protein [Acidimicrobiia bacterium EGI L10123]